MKAKVTVLGCGNSTGVPAIGNYWGKCDPNEPKNKRTRCSIAVQTEQTTLIVDTGPDFSAQLTRENINHIDGVFYSHAHSDHVNGMDELRIIRFRNNALSACLREDNPQCVRAMILMHNSPEMSSPWMETLEEGIRTGQTPFALKYGDELFDYMDTHPDFDLLFSNAMDSVEALAGDSFATDFDWSRFQRLIDIGGSAGSKSRAILQRHPGLQALVQDRPAIIAKVVAANAQRQRDEVDGRMTFVGGDAFVEVPAARNAGDVYLLSALLHGFEDAQCEIILRNVVRAMGEGDAPLVILEIVMAEQGADYSSVSFDMQMFIGTRGRERTLAQWQALLARSGLALREQVNLQSFAKMLVCTPLPHGVAAISSTTL